MVWNPLSTGKIALTATMPPLERHQAPRVCPIDEERIAVITCDGAYVMQFHYSKVRYTQVYAHTY